MKIKYFASGFFLFARNFSRGIQKSYLEHRAGIRKTRKMKGKKVLTKIKDMMTSENVLRWFPPEPPESTPVVFWEK